MRPVQPIAIKYWSLYHRFTHGDAMNFVLKTFLLFASIVTTGKQLYLPVFDPNDYFWQNHWQNGKEEKWEAYARAVREIISVTGDFGLSQSKMEDKMEYKSLIKSS